MKRLMIVLALLILAGCNYDLVEVKIISIQKPHAEGEGWGTTHFSAGMICEIIATKERVFVRGYLGNTGDVFRVSESRIQGRRGCMGRE